MHGSIGQLLALLSLGIVASCAPSSTIEPEAEREDGLSAKSDALWRGRARTRTVTIPVCWRPARIDPARFPVAAFAPPAGFLAERKAWVREIAEREWNARTPLRFVGWEDCGQDASSYVNLEPIDSVSQNTCGALGQSCADALGRFLLGRVVHLNLAFGDEFLYVSRFLANGGEKSELDYIQNIWIPTACFDELKEPWPGIQERRVATTARSIIENCVKINALHELGHVAGFAHEQYRQDNARAFAACQQIIEARNLSDDLANVGPQFLGDTPLGPFELESIMSYCRTNKLATLTGEDVEMTRRIYRP